MFGKISSSALCIFDYFLDTDSDDDNDDDEEDEWDD